MMTGEVYSGGGFTSTALNDEALRNPKWQALISCGNEKCIALGEKIKLHLFYVEETRRRVP